MMRRLARPFAIAGLAAAVFGAIGAIVLRIVDHVPMVETAFGFGDVALVGFEFFGVTFAAVGALLVVRRPTNAVGWCMVLIGVGHALAGYAGAVASSALADGPAAVGTAQAAGWLTVLFVMTGGFMLIGLGLIFPTGRGHTVFWDRLVRLAAIVLPVIVVALFLLRPGPLQLFAAIENPFGVGPDLRSILGARSSEIFAASTFLIAPLLGLSIASRYRMSDRVGQQQLKWFVLALLVSVVGIAAAAVGALLGRQAPEAGLVVFGFAGALIPVAIGVAILRYRLYDIDRIISRSVSYTVLTGVLVVIFAATTVALSAVLGSFAQGESLAVAGATLLVFASFGPLRKRAQVAVDRRFDRSQYDASRTIQALTVRLRDDVDLERIEADVLGVVGRTFYPSSSGVWIRRNETTVRHSPVTIPGRPPATVTPT